MIVNAMNKRQIEQDSTQATDLEGAQSQETQEPESAAVLALVMAEGSSSLSEPRARGMNAADDDDKGPIEKSRLRVARQHARDTADDDDKEPVEK